MHIISLSLLLMTVYSYISIAARIQSTGRYNICIYACTAVGVFVRRIVMYVRTSDGV